MNYKIFKTDNGELNITQKQEQKNIMVMQYSLKQKMVRMVNLINHEDLDKILDFFTYLESIFADIESYPRILEFSIFNNRVKIENIFSWDGSYKQGIVQSPLEVTK